MNLNYFYKLQNKNLKLAFYAIIILYIKVLYCKNKALIQDFIFLFYKKLVKFTSN